MGEGGGSDGVAGLRAWGSGRGREGACGFLPQAIYRLKKACRVEMEAEQHGQLLTPEEVVDRIFLLVDENGDGKGGGGLPTPHHPPFLAVRPWTRPSTSPQLGSWVQRGGRRISRDVILGAGGPFKLSPGKCSQRIGALDSGRPFKQPGLSFLIWKIGIMTLQRNK